MEINNAAFSEIKPFAFSATYIELDSKSPLNVYDNHIHNECEIYINVSGDVSFAVENSVYPLMPGGIIITRPFEYHHCIYHTNKLHKHFWILFSADGNERLLDAFYRREAGKNNLLTLHGTQTDELFKICRRLTAGCKNEVEKYYSFFGLINLLNNASTVNISADSGSDFVIKAINLINGNLSGRISVSQIADECGVSVNTLDRHFLKRLNISPSGYIRKKRLANATKLLDGGCNVTEAAEMSGFSDCSSFISLFKELYHTTPLKYKKRDD